MNPTNSSTTPAAQERVTSPWAGLRELNVKRILCATDFSTCSRRALLQALSLARHFHSEIVLLHVFDPGPPQVEIVVATLAESSLREEADQQLAEWVAYAKGTARTTSLLQEGKAAWKQILAVAEETQADLIVLGKHGHSALGRALMGSTAEKTVRLARCPVLVIPEENSEAA